MSNRKARIILLPEAFGRAVRARRAELDLTQGKLGERAGLDRTYISGIERNRRNPTLEVIERISEGLDAKPSVLFASAERIAEEAAS